ncbi:MAG: hypothetical protein ABIA59_02985, partial [Candidatus Latescibacterota bacterium]
DPGPWDVDIVCEGIVNGAVFAQTVRTSDDGDFLNVVIPADIDPQVASLKPDLVSSFTNVFFEVDFENQGGADVILNTDSTRISFGSGVFDANLDAALADYNAPLNPGLNTTIGNGITTLTFLTQTVMVADGDYRPRVRIVGTENGIPYKKTFTLTDTLHVQAAPEISIIGIAPSQPRITADQGRGFALSMGVNNSGQATVRFDSASVRFILGGGDRTGQFVITDPVSFDGGSYLSGSHSDFVTFNVSDNVANLMSTGNMTIEGTLWVTDEIGPTHITANTDLGNKGSLLVESAAAVVVRSIIPSQNPVTAGQDKVFQIRMTIENTGGSDVHAGLHADSTYLDFTAPDDWVWTIQPALEGGGTVLEGGAIGTVVFDVTKAGTKTGPVTITGTFGSEELNSGRNVIAASTGSITVQSPAQINFTGVTTSRPTVTAGSGADWVIQIGLVNGGQSDVALILPDSVTIRIQNEILGTVYIKPSSLVEGGTVLHGGAFGTLMATVDQTGSFSSFGSKNIDVRVAGNEVNSGRSRAGTGAGSVIVQTQPDLQYAANSLDPDTVSSGSNVPFRVALFNTAGIDGATIRLDRDLTRLRFGTPPNAFAAPLASSSVDSLPGGVLDTLLFAATWVDTLIPPGAQNVLLDLWWEQNGSPGSKPISLPGKLLIQDAPRLNIVEIRPSQSTVTRNQPGGSWHVTMVLKNNGSVGVDLDLAAAATKLKLKTLGGLDVTGEYAFQQPAGLFTIGGTVLPGGWEDSLRFDVLTTGSTEGLIIISGEVRGEDELSHAPLFDNTFDGGFGSVTVQSAANMQILSITPQQPAATAGQVAPFKVWMAVRNNGASAVRIHLNPDSTQLMLPLPDGWLWDVEPSLAGGGDILAGHSTGTVVFTVKRVGNSAGTFRIDGEVRGFEINTSSALLDGSLDAGWGSLLIQTPAALVIDSVSPSRLTVTQGSDTDWTIAVQVTNTGGSNLSLIIPDSASATIDDETSGSTIQKPFQLAGGGTLLQSGATGVLVFTVTNTGLFSSLGLKNVNIRIAGRELNSNRNVPAVNSGSVTVQVAPDPTYVNNSLIPPSGTRGEKVQYKIKIVNSDPAAASIVLERTQCQLWFASGQFEAFLDPSSPFVIAGGETLQVVFEQTDIPSSIAVGSYTVYVDLIWQENGRTDSKQLVLPELLEIQEPSGLQITQIVSQQDPVTAGQTRSWDVWMVVMNNGSASIVIDRQLAATNLIFQHLVMGDITSQYTVNPAMWLTRNSGAGDTLSGGIANTDTLLFEVTGTGFTTGTVLISGNVQGRDVNTGDIISDDGGSESILVQSEGNMAFSGITTSQPAVTEGQSSSWFARVAINNSGESDLNVRLINCRITFSGGIGNWSYVRPPVLEGGGSILEGKSGDVIVFEVDSTSAAANWGIDAYVDAMEINSGRLEVDSTGMSGFGSIAVQTQPRLRLTSTSIAAPRSPEVNTGQLFGVEVAINNSGQAKAESVYFHIENTGGSTPVPSSRRFVTGLSGGVAAVDTFMITAAAVSGTDTFSVVVDSALDANSLQRDLISIDAPALPADSFAVADIQIPAYLRIVSLVPSQDRLTRDQPTPWTVTVAVRDTGMADLQLAPPTVNDITFFISGQQQNDYVVIAPSSLA